MHASAKSPVNCDFSRGKRFLELVAKNKINVSPQMNKLATKRRFSLNEGISPRISKEQGDRDELDKEPKHFLEFSENFQFDPNASPTSSIMKRKSSAKRKRVGFSDPVSSTKEYLITEEEEKIKTRCFSSNMIRCLTYASIDKDDDTKEIQPDIKLAPDAEVKAEVFETHPNLLDHDYDEQNTDITTSFEESEKLTFKDKNELMAYVTKNLSIDELFDLSKAVQKESLKRKDLITKVVSSVGFEDLLNEYFPRSSDISAKLSPDQMNLVSSILGKLSNLMEQNNQVKHKVLNMLNESHAQDFLDHALQENSTSAVCDKIALPLITNYLVHKVNVIESQPIEEMNKLNNAILHKIIKNTDNGSQLPPEEAQELLRLLFRNVPKVEIFDVVSDFLRKLL